MDIFGGAPGLPCSVTHLLSEISEILTPSRNMEPNPTKPPLAGLTLVSIARNPLQSPQMTTIRPEIPIHDLCRKSLRTTAKRQIRFAA